MVGAILAWSITRGLLQPDLDGLERARRAGSNGRLLDVVVVFAAAQERRGGGDDAGADGEHEGVEERVDDQAGLQRVEQMRSEPDGHQGEGDADREDARRVRQDREHLCIQAPRRPGGPTLYNVIIWFESWIGRRTSRSRSRSCWSRGCGR